MGALGSRGTVGHKNNACRDKNGRAGPDLGPMAGEISPNIMFCKKRAKGVRTAPHGCTWVRMGAVVCICNGGTGKQGKMSQKSVVRTCFRCGHGQQNQHIMSVRTHFVKKKHKNEQ